MATKNTTKNTTVNKQLDEDDRVTEAEFGKAKSSGSSTSGEPPPRKKKKDDDRMGNDADTKDDEVPKFVFFDRLFKKLQQLINPGNRF